MKYPEEFGKITNLLVKMMTIIVQKRKYNRKKVIKK